MTSLRLVTEPAHPDAGACLMCSYLLSREDAPAYWRCGARGAAYTSIVNPQGRCTSWVWQGPPAPRVVTPRSPISPLWIVVAIVIGAAFGSVIGILILR